MFKFLKGVFGKPKDQSVVFDNAGATVKIKMFYSKDAITFYKWTSSVAVALRLPFNSIGTIDTGFLFRMNNIEPLDKPEDVYTKGVLKSIFVYHKNPLPTTDVRIIKKLPLVIKLNGSNLIVGNESNTTLDLDSALGANALKEFFWALGLPLMGPSTLLWPLQEDYVKTLYDIAQKGRIVDNHSELIVKFLERYHYITRHQSGEITVTKRAGKVFKTAMAATDMRDATLRLEQCVNYDVWPYHF